MITHVNYMASLRSKFLVKSKMFLSSNNIIGGFSGHPSFRGVFTVFFTSSSGSLLPDCQVYNEVYLSELLGWSDYSNLLCPYDIGGVLQSKVASAYRRMEVSQDVLFLQKQGIDHFHVMSLNSKMTPRDIFTCTTFNII